MNRLYPEQQVDVTKIDANFQEICADGWATEDRLAVNSVTASKLVNGAATDIKIGTRLMDDTTAPASKSGMLQDHLNNIGYMIKSITGKEDCITAPAKSIADLVAAKPIARVTKSTPQTLTTTATIVKFDTETFDVGGYFNTTTYQYTPPAGYYRVTATGVAKNVVDILTIAIYKANSSYLAQTLNLSGATAYSFPFCVSDVVSVNGSETIDFRATISNPAANPTIDRCAIVFEKISD